MHGNMRLLDESTVKAVSGIAVGEDEIFAAITPVFDAERFGIKVISSQIGRAHV